MNNELCFQEVRINRQWRQASRGWKTPHAWYHCHYSFYHYNIKVHSKQVLIPIRIKQKSSIFASDINLKHRIYRQWLFAYMTTGNLSWLWVDKWDHSIFYQIYQ